MLQVQPLQPQPTLGATPPSLGVTTATPQQISSVGTVGNQQPYTPPAPTDNSSSNLNSQIAQTLAKAQQQYPGQDDAILQAFIRDNQKTMPNTVKQIEGLMSNARTARNNNPTALTTSVAQALGGVEGVDYTQGDPFKSSTGQTLYTAKLNGDPIQATVNLFNKAAANGTPIFDTGSGTPRWSYAKDITNAQWEAMTPQQQQNTVAAMQSNESGSKPAYSATQILGSLIKDNTTTQSSPSNQTNQPQNYPGSDIPLSTAPGTATLEQTGEFIKNGLLSPLHFGDFALKGLATGIQNVKSVAQAAMGNNQGALQTQGAALNTPFGAIPTLGSSTVGQNLGTALEAASAGAGLSSTLPAIASNSIVSGGISGGVQGLLGGVGQYAASNNRPDLKTSQGISGALEAGGQGLLGGVATGAGAAAVQPVVTGEANPVQALQNKQNQIANDKVWQMIKDPDLEPNTNKPTMTGTVASVEPTTAHDQQLIQAAKPYVTDDPIQTKANLKNGVATQSQSLENGLVGKGGTWSDDTLQGVLNKTKVPLALKNTAEMAVVKNVNNYVMELASDPNAGITRDASGSLKLSKQFRSSISSEYGENIWDKDTPAAQYIRNINQALNGLTESRLPNGNLPDGTPFKKAMQNISLLSEARDNVEIPKAGKQTSNNVLGSTLKLAKPLVKPVLQGVGLGAVSNHVENLIP